MIQSLLYHLAALLLEFYMVYKNGIEMSLVGLLFYLG